MARRAASAAAEKSINEVRPSAPAVPREDRPRVRTGRAHIRMLFECVRRLPGRLFRGKKRTREEDRQPTGEVPSPSQLVFEAMRSAIMEDPEWMQFMDAETSGDCVTDAFLQMEFDKIAAFYMDAQDHELDNVSLDELLTANSGGNSAPKMIGFFAGPRRDRKKARPVIKPSVSAGFFAKRRTEQTNGSPKKQQCKPSAK
ncbi:hypothetical protein AAHC03_017227 [Spirometra sp. Aus1]